MLRVLIGTGFDRYWVDRYLVRRYSMVMLGRLGLTLGWKGKVSKLELGSLSISTDKISLLGIQESERLRARAVRVDTHPSLKLRQIERKKFMVICKIYNCTGFPLATQ